MPRKTIENCPVSEQTPPAQVDEDGFCSEHGWDCDDFQSYVNDWYDDVEYD